MSLFFRDASRCAALACIGLALTLSACATAQKPQDKPEKPLSDQAAQQQQAFSGFKKRRDRIREEQSAAIAELAPDRARREVDTSWAIVLYMFRGNQALEGAKQGLYKVQTQLGLQDAYLGERSGGIAILYGKYTGPQDQRAQTDLATIKAIEIEGEPLFTEAILAPPQAAPGEGALPDFDLALVKDTNPEAVYTLQVGIYRNMDGRDATAQELADFRDAAERAVVALRAQGQEAYYYHGPRSSTVTVGLFADEDYMISVRDELGQMQKLPRPRLSARVRDAMDANPYNLVNGQGVKDGKRDRPQASFLIRVPR
ncbi:MAG: hypothetical protein ACK5Q4_17040 [Phycisphaerae bacterium]|jgi:hypothetical protein